MGSDMMSMSVRVQITLKVNGHGCEYRSVVTVERIRKENLLRLKFSKYQLIKPMWVKSIWVNPPLLAAVHQSIPLYFPYWKETATKSTALVLFTSQVAVSVSVNKHQVKFV